jgi:hypothetical protein
MPTPDQLAVDLHDLWFAANALRDMAGAHKTANTAVDGCAPSSCFDRPDGVGLGPTGCYSDWQGLSDQITEMLTQNASNLEDTAVAMELCIKTYTEQDEAVRQAFEARKRAIPYE